METRKIKILIADDQTILRQGLRRILEAESDLAVVGETATGTEAVKKARQLKPDVVIMDIAMPEQDGIENVRQIVRSAPQSRALILSAHLNQQIVSEAVSAGAAGYLSKDSTDRELISAIHTVVHGGTVFSANVGRLLADYSQNGRATSARALDALTTREREVFFLLAEGKSPAEVAAALFVSPKTVHTHRQHIMEKLGLQSTTALIRFALRHGLINSV